MMWVESLGISNKSKNRGKKVEVISEIWILKGKWQSAKKRDYEKEAKSW